MLPESRPLSSCKTASQVYGTCYACKWWEVECADVWGAVVTWDTGICRHYSTGDFLLSAVILDGPASRFVPEGHAGIITYNTFGCVHFEPKPTENTDT